MRSSLPLSFATLLVAVAAGGAALAQTAECQSWRAELAALDRGGSRDLAVAQRQRQEIARLSAYYDSIGCGRGQFLFFNSPPPAECAAIAQRINMMQASSARIAGGADSYGSDARRRQLLAAIQQACSPHVEAAIRVEQPLREGEDRRRFPGDEVPLRRLGGDRLICVRTCDGYFFPLHNLPSDGRSDADDMCRALCPAAEAAAYSMPSGPNADLSQAISLRGKRYTRLASAFKYQKRFDASCSCRKPGQSWAEALQKAERMIERGPGDIIVTAKKAEELSRPRLARKPAVIATQAQVRSKTPDVETTGAIAPAKAESKLEPVAAVSATYTSAPEKGEREQTGEPNAKRSIRVIGPNVISVPQQTPGE